MKILGIVKLLLLISISLNVERFATCQCEKQGTSNSNHDPEYLRIFN